MKPGHDGHIAYIKDGQLAFSMEAEKDSWPRYSEVGPVHLLQALENLDSFPDVVAISGWSKVIYEEAPSASRFPSVKRHVSSLEGGYFADERSIVDRTINIMGRPVRYFSSSHEKSHIYCAYGLSGVREGSPCYVLVWEGSIGAFYHIDEKLQVTHLGSPLTCPGLRYQFLYGLADPGYLPGRGDSRFEDAGKLMAIAAFGEPAPITAEEDSIIKHLLSTDNVFGRDAKRELSGTRYHDIGVEHGDFARLARHYSDAIFSTFHRYAVSNLKPDLPLLIAGGCGLNCDWNRSWEDCGHFSEVFVPPCTNDTGAAIGTAIEAQNHYGGPAKIAWSVYSGQEFTNDAADLTGFERVPLDLAEISEELAAGCILGWVQGRCEVGPRALGNRSILAAPFLTETRDRLNSIKKREPFRPIAPVCLAEDMKLHFDRATPSPYMLFFQRVLNGRLKAVTHVDGSARCQSVTAEQNRELYRLLRAFKAKTGVGVLCNTSLNFKGTGFINRLSDLARYARTVGLDGFVVGEAYFRRHQS
jgi:hydroxymethyl cephem carbamoyltransferase